MDSYDPLRHGSLDLYESPSDGISIGLAVFAQLARVANTQTDKQTHRPRCSSRPHLMHCVQAMRPNNNDISNSNIK